MHADGHKKIFFIFMCAQVDINKFFFISMCMHEYLYRLKTYLRDVM